jgi:hypothetical protein
VRPGRDWEITFGADGAHIRAFEYDRWARRRCSLVLGVLILLGRPQDARYLGRIDWVCALASRITIAAIKHEYATHRTVLDLLVAAEDAKYADPAAWDSFEMLTQLDPDPPC